MASSVTQGESIPSIPTGESGVSFVWYGDCCSGISGANEQNFAAVNTVFRRLDAYPDVVIFAGDNIVGYSDNAEDYRAQWRYWLDHEMAWFSKLGIPIFHITSNHNTTNEVAEAVFREIHTDIPQNGPDDQKGLSYWVRRGDVLYVFVNTNFSGLGGSGHVEHEWLDRVLTDQADVRFKLVIGHHPVFGINGHDLYPSWRITPEEGAAFWEVLVRHGVFAYVCSHILAFDVKVHQGVLQITTGGAGTYGMPVLGLMPETTEYLHLVQAALDERGLRYQVLDTTGIAREWLRWPEPALEASDWEVFDPAQPPAGPASSSRHVSDGDAWVARFHVTGRTAPSSDAQTMLCGWQSWEGPEAIWIGISEGDSRLIVQLVPRPGQGAQCWIGPQFPQDAPLDIEIAIHSGMGPGGVLWRTPGGVWSSLRSNSARGADQLVWPENWNLGHGQSGSSDRAFAGADLRVEYAISTVSKSALFTN